MKKVNAIKGTKDNRGHAGRGLLCGQLERLWEMPRDRQRNGVLPVSLNLTSSFVGAYRTSLSLYGGPRSLPERQPAGPFEKMMMIVLFTVLFRNKLRIPLEYVLLGEIRQNFKVVPSCGLTTEPHLSEPLWAPLLGVPYMGTSSPTLSHFPRWSRGPSISLSAYASLPCGG